MVMKRELGALRCSTQTTKHERREACRQNVDNRAFTELKSVWGREGLCGGLNSQKRVADGHGKTGGAMEVVVNRVNIHKLCAIRLRFGGFEDQGLRGVYNSLGPYKTHETW
jgi:hypothetical protein